MYIDHLCGLSLGGLGPGDITRSYIYIMVASLTEGQRIEGEDRGDPMNDKEQYVSHTSPLQHVSDYTSCLVI